MNPELEYFKLVHTRQLKLIYRKSCLLERAISYHGSYLNSCIWKLTFLPTSIEENYRIARWSSFQKLKNKSMDGKCIVYETLRGVQLPVIDQKCMWIRKWIETSRVHKFSSKNPWCISSPSPLGACHEVTLRTPHQYVYQSYNKQFHCIPIDRTTKSIVVLNQNYLSTSL